MTTGDKIMNDITQIVINHLTLNETTEFKTQNMKLTYEKNNVSEVKLLDKIDDAKIIKPSFCDLFSNLNNMNCQNQIITQKVENI